MNSGSEPERDDTGLPPVDIEIPDDARELDRDVQAYYREQRAQRRQLRRSRLHGFLSKDGIVLPLLASCLILALITGTLLTVFTAASDQGFPTLPGTGGQASSTIKPTNRPTGSASTGGTSTRPSTGATTAGNRPPAVHAAGPATPIALPDTALLIGATPVQLRSLSRAVLVLVPTGCSSCAATVMSLAQFAASAHARAYLVATTRQLPAIAGLVRSVNRQPRAAITLAVDSRGALGRYLQGVTAILVGPDRVAAVAGHLVANERFDLLLPALRG